MIHPAVPRPGNEAGSTQSRPAPPEANAYPGIEAAHEDEWQEVEENHIDSVEDVFVVLLHVGDADYIDAA